MTIRNISQDHLSEVLREHLTPSAHITTPERLFGREGKLRQIGRAFNSVGRHVFIYGDRGVGKSSLALTAAHMHHGSGSDPIYVPCSETSTFGDIIQAVGNASFAVTERFEHPGSPSSLNMTIMGSGGGLSRGSRPRPEIEKPTDLNSAFDVIRYVASRLQGNIVVVIDEYERITEEADKTIFAEFMRSVPDFDGRMKFVFCGIGSTVDELLGSHTSVGRRLETVELERLHHDHLWRIITAVSEKLDVEIDREMLIRIGITSDGFPHYVHLIGESLFWKMFDDNEEVRRAGARHYKAGVNGALTRTEAILRTAYFKATQKTKNTEDYEVALWSLADHHNLRRQVTEIYNKSYLPISQQLGKRTGERLTKSQFNNRLLRLREESHDRVLVGHGSGWFSFRENVLRGYVRLNAENRGITLARDHYITT